MTRENYPLEMVKKKTLAESLQILNDSLTLAKTDGDTKRMKILIKCIARIKSLKKKKDRLKG